ncbi:hypothetical protein [Lewinella sp. JB7]|uniref:hypothetical protein n=1 Tax=Lewinella sp. JB7 TaxID=2962887 RepID=UPI0020C9877D|nr:hypothetical protein [Lewinella sp. JB7]MCP9237962.1 hypothetical protein [Lewinella sp. JB7]
MKYTILPNDLTGIADSAHEAIKMRYGLGDASIEMAIEKSVPIRPTFHWKEPTEIIMCEVAQRPFPVVIKELFADISASGLPIRIIVAYPRDAPMSAKSFQDDVKLAKKFGIGLLAVDDDGRGKIEYQGVSISLHFPEIKYDRFPKAFRPLIKDAYENYMDQGNPKAGLQELGQIVEDCILKIGIDAKKKNQLVTNSFKPEKFIACNRLLDLMIKEEIIDIGILGTAKTFMKARNGVSHKPKSRKAAIERDLLMKENFQIGLRLLAEIPNECKKHGLKFK